MKLVKVIGVVDTKVLAERQRHAKRITQSARKSTPLTFLLGDKLKEAFRKN